MIHGIVDGSQGNVQQVASVGLLRLQVEIRARVRCCCLSVGFKLG